MRHTKIACLEIHTIQASDIWHGHHGCTFSGKRWSCAPEGSFKKPQGSVFLLLLGTELALASLSALQHCRFGFRPPGTCRLRPPGVIGDFKNLTTPRHGRFNRFEEVLSRTPSIWAEVRNCLWLEILAPKSPPPSKTPKN